MSNKADLLPPSSIEVREALRLYHRLLSQNIFRSHSSKPVTPTPEQLEFTKQCKEQDKKDNYFPDRNIGKIALTHGFTDPEKFVGFLSGGRILDIGAGSASFAKVMRNRAKQTEVVSLDRELPEVRRHLSRYVLADAGVLPFADNTFDRVVSSYSVPYWSDSVEESISCLKQMYRVTKPGGYLMVAPFVDGAHVKVAGVMIDQAGLAPLDAATYSDMYRDMKLIEQMAEWEFSNQISVNTRLTNSVNGGAISLTAQKLK